MKHDRNENEKATKCAWHICTFVKWLIYPEICWKTHERTFFFSHQNTQIQHFDRYYFYSAGSKPATTITTQIENENEKEKTEAHRKEKWHFFQCLRRKNIGIREKRERTSTRTPAYKKSIVIIKIKVVHLFFRWDGFLFWTVFFFSFIYHTGYLKVYFFHLLNFDAFVPRMLVSNGQIFSFCEEISNAHNECVRMFLFLSMCVCIDNVKDLVYFQKRMNLTCVKIHLDLCFKVFVLRIS